MSEDKDITSKSDLAESGHMMGLNHHPHFRPNYNPHLDAHLTQRMKKEKKSEQLY